VRTSTAATWESFVDSPLVDRIGKTRTFVIIGAEFGGGAGDQAWEGSRHPQG